MTSFTQTKQTIAQAVNGVLRRVPAWPLYIVAVIPPVFMFFAALNGKLGVDPVKSLEHEMGELGLQVLIAVLAISPLRRLTGISLIKFRRALGLIGFFYIFLHLLVWLVLDVQIVDQIVKDIIKRPYITIGMAAFVLMIPLAITSNNWSLRRLGPKWRSLHKLTYPAVILGGVHFVWLVKGWQLEPLIYLAVILGLLALRVKPKRRVARS
ncbi:MULTISPECIES: protein-methionine-sulfoxide reductase heme-binding subunit MsrQ [Pacificibacter]|uniref:protein-methionine-sulfoxide reductase heme-binding subunit MsrQ n=1 Tax=Pacificibacter TaxID=1042323 RepID=UPI001C08AB83|nr:MULTISPECIES: protein-methionine-sulfoxide reductase heme-binding subunit MsrQ [Pacificibacter]MBU2935960.1 protein-methionine-sulfoxide reductase heme-binding subunit MsrQ [Pacificibacter marinus]MDO6615191.1 protein-methionine-sulfoxide reductase heme-binding subunit MsrQ [Pacificibacter sp. 1_MG-2023]